MPHNVVLLFFCIRYTLKFININVSKNFSKTNHLGSAHTQLRIVQIRVQSNHCMVLHLDLTFSVARTVFRHLFLACNSIIFQLYGVGMFYHANPPTAESLSAAEHLINLFFHRSDVRESAIDTVQRYLKKRVMGEQSNLDKV